MLVVESDPPDPDADAEQPMVSRTKAGEDAVTMRLTSRGVEDIWGRTSRILFRDPPVTRTEGAFLKGYTDYQGLF